MLEILADQRDQLAQLASDSEQILRPLSAQRSHVAGFLSNAGAAGQATAENAAPSSKRRCRSSRASCASSATTMRSLQGFSDATTPVVNNLDRATPALTEATRHLGPFTSASTVALKALGNAGEASGPIFREADPVVKRPATWPAPGPARRPSSPSSWSAPRRPRASTTSSN